MLLQNDYRAFFIIGVFLGQMAPPMLYKLQENFIFLVYIPPNTTNLFQLFQPLDLTVNGAAKVFMKGRFTGWYSQEIWRESVSGKELNHINIKISRSFLSFYMQVELMSFTITLRHKKKQKQYLMAGSLLV